jgi:hypothetical protein
MSKALNAPEWKGVLASSRGNSIVFRDASLPEAAPGRVYLYNADRGAVVEYVAEIVSAKLRDFTDAEAAALDAGIEKKWKTARDAFIREQRGRSSSSSTKGKKSSDEEVETNIDDIELDVVDGSMEDDWGDTDTETAANDDEAYEELDEA